MSKGLELLERPKYIHNGIFTNMLKIVLQMISHLQTS